MTNQTTDKELPEVMSVDDFVRREFLNHDNCFCTYTGSDEFRRWLFSVIERRDAQLLGTVQPVKENYHLDQEEQRILTRALKASGTVQPKEEWRTGEPPVNSIGLSEPLNFYSISDNGDFLALGHYDADKKIFIETDKSQWSLEQVDYWRIVDLPPAPDNQKAQQ